VSRLGDEQAIALDLAEADCHRNARSLERIKRYLEQHNCPVRGGRYLDALEQLRTAQPERTP
jgi:hypothetical protein